MAITTYNQRRAGITLHQITRKTHLEIANQLGLSLSAVAIIREVLAGTSPQALRALKKHNNDHTKAAIWLAEYRRRYQVAKSITVEAVEQIAEIDGRDS